METGIIVSVRNVLMFSLIMANGAVLFPESALNASRSLRRLWKRFQAGVRALGKRKKHRAPGSFWIVDMTKFEP